MQALLALKAPSGAREIHEKAGLASVRATSAVLGRLVNRGLVAMLGSKRPHRYQALRTRVLTGVLEPLKREVRKWEVSLGLHEERREGRTPATPRNER